MTDQPSFLHAEGFIERPVVADARAKRTEVLYINRPLQQGNLFSPEES